MKVAQEYGGLGARDYQNEIDYGEEAEHVVELVRPNAVEYEEQLYEYAAEWKNAAHEDAGYWLRVKVLGWYLTRYLIRSHWVLDDVLFEAQVRADEDEWCADKKPQGQKAHQGKEWHRRRATIDPQYQIQYEYKDEHNS